MFIILDCKAKINKLFYSKLINKRKNVVKLKNKYKIQYIK